MAELVYCLDFHGWKIALEKETLETLCDNLLAIPAVKIKRVINGTWIDKGYHEEWTFECSACGGYSPEEYGFCPHCGADMQLTASNKKKHKTYIEDFFEKFPNCVRGCEDSTPSCCRDLIYGTRNKECLSEPNCCVTCWNTEMEDEEVET